MNPTQIQLVQASFEQVKPIAPLAADLFYTRLFEQAPALRHMFRGDLTEQKQKLMAALTLVVAGLDRPETIVPAVQHLGRKHAGYGAQPADYAAVGAALLWTLERGLGAAFTPAVADAWLAAYTLLAGVMQAAAADAVPA